MKPCASAGACLIPLTRPLPLCPHTHTLRAKNIQNEAHVNEDVDQRTLLRKYERELRRLRDELARRSRNVVDKRALLVVGRRPGGAGGRRAEGSARWRGVT